jgi:hypothetical protein
MTFVDLYLPYFRQQLITHQLSALLPFQALFTENSCRYQHFKLPLFSSALTALCPFCCMFLFSSLYILFNLGFFLAGRY